MRSIAVTACAEDGPEAPGDGGSEVRESGEPTEVDDAPEPISEANPRERIPMIDAYYEGEKAWFIHTDVSDGDMAERLSRMVGYRTMHVPELAGIPNEHAGEIYVFRNGVDRGGLAFVFNGGGVPLSATGIVHPVWVMVAMAVSVSAVLLNGFEGRILPSGSSSGPTEG